MDLFREELRNFESNMEKDMEKDSVKENREKEDIQTIEAFKRILKEKYETYKTLKELEKLGGNIDNGVEALKNEVNELLDNAVKNSLISQNDKLSIYEKFGINYLKKEDKKRETDEQEK